MEQRKNVLTESDLESLRELLAEHPCRYPFTTKQANNLADFADKLDTAQNITFKLIVSAISLVVIGWIGKGFIQWLVNLAKTGGQQ